MNKKNMMLGVDYKLKYLSRQGRVLALGGYSEMSYSERYDEVRSRLEAKPYDPERKKTPLNLVLAVNTDDEAMIEAAADYSEADYLRGDPVPEGHRLIAIPSHEVEYLWSDFLIADAANKKARAAWVEKANYRKEVTRPQVQAELERLGLTRYVRDYELLTYLRLGYVNFTLEEFLLLAARIPVEDK